MKRIVILLPNLNGGGAERVVVNIANILDRSGYDVHLILAQNTGVYFKQLEKTISLHLLNYSKILFSGFGIAKLLRHIQPEVVLSTTHRMNFVASMVQGIFQQKYRLILRLPSSPKAEIKFNRLNTVMLFLYGLAYRRSNYVLAQSEAMKDEARDVFKLQGEKMRVLINPLDCFEIDKSIERSKNPFDTKRKNILAVGRIDTAKGFDFLIESFALVIQKKPNYLLHIIGDDKGEKASLVDLTKKLKIESHVVFWGHQGNPYPFYKNCDLYVLSSRWEGVPNTLLECLYLECPVIATTCVPIVNEFISDGQNGYLVSFGDEKLLAEKILSHSSLVPRKKIIAESKVKEIIFG